MLHCNNNPDFTNIQMVLEHIDTSINSIQDFFDRLSEVEDEVT